MAITTGRSPIIMDAQGDDLATVWQGRDMNQPTPGIPLLKLTMIRYISGAAGALTLTSNVSGGTIIFQSATLAAAGAVDSTQYGDSYWTDGVYVLTMPAGGKVFLYYD